MAISEGNSPVIALGRVPFAVCQHGETRANEERRHNEYQHRAHHSRHVAIHGATRGGVLLALAGSRIEVRRNASGQR